MKSPPREKLIEWIVDSNKRVSSGVVQRSWTTVGVPLRTTETGPPSLEDGIEGLEPLRMQMETLDLLDGYFPSNVDDAAAKTVRFFSV